MDEAEPDQLVAPDGEALNLEPYPSWAHGPMRQIFQMMPRLSAPADQPDADMAPGPTLAAATTTKQRPIPAPPPYAEGEPRTPIITPEFMREIARKENPGLAVEKIPLDIANPGSKARGMYQLTPGALTKSGLAAEQKPWIGRTTFNGRRYQISLAPRRNSCAAVNGRIGHCAGF